LESLENIEFLFSAWVSYSSFKGMFIRRKKNKTGTISVQVIDKSSGRYKVIHSAGSSADPAIIAGLTEQAKHYIHKIKRQGEFNFLLGDDVRYYQSVY